MLMNLSNIMINLTILRVKMVSWKKNQDSIISASDEVGLSAFRMGKNDLVDTDLQTDLLSFTDDIRRKTGVISAYNNELKTKKQLLADISKLEARLVREYEIQDELLDASIKELLKKD